MMQWKDAKTSTPKKEGNFLVQRRHGMGHLILEYQVCHFGGEFWDDGEWNINAEIYFWADFKRATHPEGCLERQGISLD